MTAALIWFLKAIGCLWVVGGVLTVRMAWFESRIDTMISDLDRIADRLGEEPVNADNDAGRAWWLIWGGVLTGFAGAALIVGSWIALPILGVLIAHQALYALRQRARVRAASTTEEAEEARMSSSAQRAFVLAIAIAGLVASLIYTGDLSLWGMLA